MLVYFNEMIAVYSQKFMSSRILTSYVADIDSLIRDPRSVLRNSKEGIVAIFIDNVPDFYVISTQRLAKLLELETHSAYHLNNDVTLNDQLYEEPTDSPITTSVPMGKFSMYEGWKPDMNFQQMAALWGIPLVQPVMPEELAAFVSYWQAEGKAFHHVQWQQKLARSIRYSRTSKEGIFKRDVYLLSSKEEEDKIPPGFRG